MRGGSGKHHSTLNTSRMFSEAEQAALAHGGGLTYDDLPGFPPQHAPLAEHFYRKQVAGIAATAISMNLWTCRRLDQDAIPVFE